MLIIIHLFTFAPCEGRFHKNCVNPSKGKKTYSPFNNELGYAELIVAFAEKWKLLVSTDGGKKGKRMVIADWQSVKNGQIKRKMRITKEANNTNTMHTCTNQHQKNARKK